MDESGPTSAAIRSLTFIGRLQDQVRDIELALVEHVKCAREQGASWRMIGVALGTSTQAAWERYRPLDPTAPLSRAPWNEQLPLE